MSLIKYACYIANIIHTTIMLNEHTNPAFLCIYTKIQPTVTNTSHIIGEYVLETDLPLKYHIYTTYVSYFMCRYQTTVSVYIPHVNSLQSIIWPWTQVYLHFILLAYAPGQIYVSHCTYTGGSHLNHFFWEHENLSDLWVIWLISTLKYTNYTKIFLAKIWVKWESTLTAVQLSQNPPVYSTALLT